jgi:hypothetical protein
MHDLLEVQKLHGKLLHASQPVELTSQAWNICLGYSITVLTCRAPHPAALQAICSGGRLGCHNQPSRVQSLDHTLSLTSGPSPMQPQEVVSPLTLEIGGKPGNYSQDGRKVAETLPGQRPLVLSSSSG